MDIQNLLCDEIQDEITHLRGLDVGTEAYKVTVDGVTKLVDRVIELEKIDVDTAEREKAREFEAEQKRKQLEKETKDRFIGNCIAVAGIVIPSVITIWGTLASFEFEKEGTVTTIMGRGFINKLLPKK